MPADKILNEMIKRIETHANLSRKTKGDNEDKRIVEDSIRNLIVHAQYNCQDWLSGDAAKNKLDAWLQYDWLSNDTKTYMQENMGGSAPGLSVKKR